MGRDQGPTADRKVEAGSQAGAPVSSSHQPVARAGRRQGLKRRVGSEEQIKIVTAGPTSPGGWSTYAVAPGLTKEQC